MTIHESIHELGTILPLIQQQQNGFTFRDRLYPFSTTEQHNEQAATNALTQLLYSEAYARRRSLQTAVSMPAVTPGYQQEQQEFIANLSAHNHTAERNDNGWQVTAVYPQGQLAVSKQGIKQVLQPYEFESAAQPAVNAHVTRKYVKEHRTLQPAFYYVYSETFFDHAPTILRVYWNIDAQGAAMLVESITTVINRYRIPFLFKCLNHPVLYNRRDAAVLYIQKRFAAQLNVLLPTIIEEVNAYLQDDVPLFTYRAAAGVGIAESPVNGDSFGMVRSRLVASAMMQAPQEKNTTQQLQQIIHTFSQHGISTEAPYVNRSADPGYMQAFNYSSR